MSDDLSGYPSQATGGVSDDRNKYSNNNIKYFNNNHLSSIKDLMEQAETYNLEGQVKKNFESVIEIMFNSKFISVCGENIPHEIVRKR